MSASTVRHIGAGETDEGVRDRDSSFASDTSVIDSGELFLSRLEAGKRELGRLLARQIPSRSSSHFEVRSSVANRRPNRSELEDPLLDARSSTSTFRSPKAGEISKSIESDFQRALAEMREENEALRDALARRTAQFMESKAAMREREEQERAEVEALARVKSAVIKERDEAVALFETAVASLKESELASSSFMDAAQATEEALRAEIDTMKAQIRGLEKGRQEAGDHIAGLEQDLNSAHLQADAASARYREDIARAESQLAVCMAAAASKQQQLVQQIGDLQSHVKDQMSKLQESGSKEQQLVEQIGELESRLKMQEGKLEECASKEQQLVEQIGELESRLKLQAGKLEESHSTVMTTRAEMDNLRNHVLLAQAEAESARNAMAMAQKRADAAESKLREESAIAASRIQSMEKEHRQRLQDLTARLDSAAMDHAKAAEAAEARIRTQMMDAERRLAGASSDYAERLSELQEGARKTESAVVERAEANEAQLLASLTEKTGRISELEQLLGAKEVESTRQVNEFETTLRMCCQHLNDKPLQELRATIQFLKGDIESQNKEISALREGKAAEAKARYGVEEEKAQLCRENVILRAEITNMAAATELRAKTMLEEASALSSELEASRRIADALQVLEAQNERLSQRLVDHEQVLRSTLGRMERMAEVETDSPAGGEEWAKEAKQLRILVSLLSDSPAGPGESEGAPPQTTDGPGQAPSYPAIVQGEDGVMLCTNALQIRRKRPRPLAAEAFSESEDVGGAGTGAAVGGDPSGSWFSRLFGGSGSGTAAAAAGAGAGRSEGGAE